MTDQEINVAIAECCGWYWVTIGPLYCPWVNPKTKEQFENVPNYYTSLDAMHEAEKTLEFGEEDEYPELLAKIMQGSNIENIHCGHFIWHSTARQRAEAFLRVKGKWK